MQIYHGLDEVPADLGATAVTIGNFDGVHLGHQHVLEQVIDQAQRRGAHTVAVTFDPHPAFIHRPEATPDLLTGTSEKLSRLQAAGSTPPWCCGTPKSWPPTRLKISSGPTLCRR